MRYIINLYVQDEQGNEIDDLVIEKTSPNMLTSFEIKSSVDKTKYEIISEELSSKEIIHNDNDIVKIPFLTYTLKVK